MATGGAMAPPTSENNEPSLEKIAKEAQEFLERNFQYLLEPQFQPEPLLPISSLCESSSHPIIHNSQSVPQSLSSDPDVHKSSASPSVYSSPSALPCFQPLSRQPSVAASFFVRAAQRLNMSASPRRHRHRHVISNFSNLLSTIQPPPALLRDRRDTNSGLGKMKVVLRVAPPKCPSENSSISSSGQSTPERVPFLRVDERRRQLSVIDPGSEAASAAPKMFAFDSIFTDDKSQTEVCSNTLVDVVQSVVNGNDGCVFAYGHPKLGKTRTMIGASEAHEMGIIPTAIAWLFRLVDEKKSHTGSKFSIRISAVLVSGKQETITDLLADHAAVPDSGISPSVYLRSDPVTGTTLINYSEIRAPNSERAANLLDAALAAANKKRADEESRNCHFLFTLHIYQCRMDKDALVSGVAGGRSRLHLFDLGSGERSNSKNSATSASLSYSALGNVILALFNGQRHIPHKESKMTQMLKEALSSITCRACMIAHVSSSPEHYSETLQTLQMASRIHRIRRKKLKFTPVSLDSDVCRPCVKTRALDEENGATMEHDYTSSSEQSCDTVIFVDNNDDIVENDFSTDRLMERLNSIESPSQIPFSSPFVVEAETTKKSNCASPAKPNRSSSLKSAGSICPSPRRKHIQTSDATTSPKVRAKSPKFSSWKSANQNQSDELWIDGPRVSRQKFDMRLKTAPQTELWVDGPKSSSSTMPRQRNSLPKELSYGFMDEHKQNMIERWVEEHTRYIRHKKKAHRRSRGSASSKRRSLEISDDLSDMEHRNASCKKCNEPAYTTSSTTQTITVADSGMQVTEDDIKNAMTIKGAKRMRTLSADDLNVENVSCVRQRNCQTERRRLCSDSKCRPGDLLSKMVESDVLAKKLEKLVQSRECGENNNESFLSRLENAMHFSTWEAYNSLPLQRRFLNNRPAFSEMSFGDENSTTDAQGSYGDENSIQSEPPNVSTEIDYVKPIEKLKLELFCQQMLDNPSTEKSEAIIHSLFSPLGRPINGKASIEPETSDSVFSCYVNKIDSLAKDFGVLGSPVHSPSMIRPAREEYALDAAYQMNSDSEILTVDTSTNCITLFTEEQITPKSPKIVGERTTVKSRVLKPNKMTSKVQCKSEHSSPKRSAKSVCDSPKTNRKTRHQNSSTSCTTLPIRGSLAKSQRSSLCSGVVRPTVISATAIQTRVATVRQTNELRSVSQPNSPTEITPFDYHPGVLRSPYAKMTKARTTHNSSSGHGSESSAGSRRKVISEKIRDTHQCSTNSSGYESIVLRDSEGTMEPSDSDEDIQHRALALKPPSLRSTRSSFSGTTSRQYSLVCTVPPTNSSREKGLEASNHKMTAVTSVSKPKKWSVLGFCTAGFWTSAKGEDEPKTDL